MATTRRDMGRRRKERTEPAPPPVVPPPKKGKRGDAAKTRIARTKEPLRSGRKVKV